ncbi:hypothetical protein CBR_g18886 [Chara braunii]|uniref:Uncharacterized protein n=1 Tax=Chara braunii TaxID=69332 RepID=A0A388KWN5_CHABU|nr:hypothetical protein CBR_g18886 [Chara braunii]|eukprot:GBG74476.1 hypothetical protein CBR_g18886 [Chara braunii]
MLRKKKGWERPTFAVPLAMRPGEFGAGSPVRRVGVTVGLAVALALIVGLAAAHFRAGSDVFAGLKGSAGFSYYAAAGNSRERENSPPLLSRLPMTAAGLYDVTSDDHGGTENDISSSLTVEDSVEGQLEDLRFRNTVSGSTQCDLTKGRWVAGPEMSPYSENTCKYIPSKWKCRREGRDTNYSRWRWQPDDCNLEQFKADVFLELFRNKTIGFVGDSILRNVFISFLCLLNAFQPVVPVNGTTFKSRFASFEVPSYGVILHYGTSHFLTVESADQEEFKAINRTREGRYYVVVHLDKVNDRLKDIITTCDAMVLGSGQWYQATGKTKFYVRNSTLWDGVDDLTAFEEGMRTVIKHIESNFKGPVVFQSYAPSHFTGGDWNSGGQCSETQPWSDDAVLEMEKLSPAVRYEEVQQRVFSETGGSVELLDITHLSMYRIDAHIVRSHRESLRDCMHWCLPGIPDTWNDMLFRILTRRPERIRQTEVHGSSGK